MEHDVIVRRTIEGFAGDLRGEERFWFQRLVNDIVAGELGFEGKVWSWLEIVHKGVVWLDRNDLVSVPKVQYIQSNNLH